MAKKRAKRNKPGPPKRYGYRPTLTVRLQDKILAVIKAAAEEHGKSLSEEIEDRLGRDHAWELSKQDIEAMSAEAATWTTAARAHAMRAAGLQILRDIEGRPTRAIVDFATLIAEADGLARGLRDGWVDPNNPPTIEPLRQRTDEEEQRLQRVIDDLKRQLAAAEAEAVEIKRRREAGVTMGKPRVE